MTRPAGTMPWWRYEEGDRHGGIFRAIDRIKAQRVDTDQAFIDAVALHGGTPHVGWTVKRAMEPQCPTNLVRRITSALVSETVQNKPRPFFLTNRAEWAKRKRCERINDWCAGAFDQAGVDKVMGRVAADAILFGTGFVKVLSEFGRIVVQRVLPNEVFVDQQDGMYGAPRELFQVRFYDRYHAAELWPDKREQILSAPAPGMEWSLGRDTDSDQILVAEAWRLPSGPETGDGVHTICIDGETLFDGEWTRGFFPIRELVWDLAPLGFYGIGVAEILRGSQASLNRLNRCIEEAQYFAGNMRVFLPRSAKVAKNHITNRVGDIIEFDGPTPPIFSTAPAVSPELYNEREWHVRNAFEEVGVSQLAVQAQKPAGLNSGRALRVFADHQSKRFLRWQQDYEQAHVDLARMMVAEMRDIATEDAETKIKYKAEGGFEVIDWKDVELPDDDLHIDVYPTGILPNTPAGRLQTLDEMAQSGLAEKIGMSPEVMAKLLDFPDLKAATRQYTAPSDLVEKTLAEMLDKGEYIPPEPFWNLSACIQLGAVALQSAQLDGAPEDRLELLRQFIADANALAAPEAPTAPPPPAPATEAPPPPDGPQVPAMAA